MAKFELLDNITHAEIKIDNRRKPEFGDNVGIVQTYPTEFADVQREFPILLRKDQNSGNYYFVALLGLDKDENLLLNSSGWQASYVPASLAKDAFAIGLQEKLVGGDVEKDYVIYIDMENPRVNTSIGESVFLKFGGNSPYIEKIGQILQAIQQGMEISKIMCTEFEKQELITAVKLEININKDMNHTLTGFYTIDEEKLRNLNAEQVHHLNGSGFLQGAYLVIASLSNIKKLINLKNNRILAANPETN